MQVYVRAGSGTLSASQVTVVNSTHVSFSTPTSMVVGSTEVIVNLNALETNAAASGESVGVLNVKTVDGTERVEVDRAFQVRMTVTYDLAETEAQAAKDIEGAEVAKEAEEAAGEKLEAQE